MAYFALIAPAQQWIDANGNPRSGYKLFQYEAGTSAKKTTYTDDTGAVANANPIILDSSGMCSSGVFGTTGAYKLVLAPPTDTDPPLSPVWTRDGVAGINDVAASEPDEWVTSALAPTYIGATSFSVAGDQTATFQVGRRIRATLSGSTRFGFIATSSFGAGITTIGVTLDSGSLDATLSAVAYGLLSEINHSVPKVPYNAFPVGTVVQCVEATPYTTRTDISTAIPTDDTIPQNTEGFQICTLNITPKSATNRLVIEGIGIYGTIANAGTVTAAIFQGATANAIAVGAAGGPAGGMTNPNVYHEMAAGGTSSITFTLRVGPSAAATNFYINGNSGGRLFGGIGAARLRVREIAA